MPFLSDNPAGFSKRERGCKRNRSAASQVAVAFLLIAFGVLLFLDNIGILRIQNIYDYWPVILIAAGFFKLTCRRSVSSLLWAFYLICGGTLFLLVNLDVIRIRDHETWPLSLVLIAVGFAALIKTLDRRAFVLRQRQPTGFVPWGGTDVLNESVVLGSLKRRVESTNFMGGEMHCVLGSIELDLRAAQLAPGAKSATIEVECVLGSIEIRVPESWRVSVQAQGVLGNVEDKTIAPRMGRGEEAPALVITGSSVMGNVELEN